MLNLSDWKNENNFEEPSTHFCLTKCFILFITNNMNSIAQFIGKTMSNQMKNVFNKKTNHGPLEYCEKWHFGRKLNFKMLQIICTYSILQRR